VKHSFAATASDSEDNPKAADTSRRPPYARCPRRSTQAGWLLRAQ